LEVGEGTAQLFLGDIAMQLSRIGCFTMLVSCSARWLITDIRVLPRIDLPPELGALSTGLILCGNAFAIAVLFRLGRSFSVMAEARGLVTGGIYRHIRHPLYLAEEIAAVGCAIQFFSLWALLLLCMQLGFQLRRMTNEERVLERRFPEYARYRQTTARLIPGIY